MTQQINHPDDLCAYINVLPKAQLEKMAKDMPEMADFVKSAGEEQRPCEACGLTGLVKQDNLDQVPEIEEEGYHVHFVCVGCAQKGEDPTWQEKEDLSVSFLDAVLHIIKLASRAENGKEKIKEALHGVASIAKGIEDDVPDEHPVLRLIADDFWAGFEDTFPKESLLLEKEVRSMTAKEQVAMLIREGNKGALAYGPGMK